MDSPEGRPPEDEEASAAQPSDSGISLRDLPELEPEEIERRLAKTRQELSNRRKILIKNLPPDATNQVVHAGNRWREKSGLRLFTQTDSLGLVCAHLITLLQLADVRKKVLGIYSSFF